LTVSLLQLTGKKPAEMDEKKRARLLAAKAKEDERIASKKAVKLSRPNEREKCQD
jgi:hypothetical protein